MINDFCNRIHFQKIFKFVDNNENVQNKWTKFVWDIQYQRMTINGFQLT